MKNNKHLPKLILSLLGIYTLLTASCRVSSYTLPASMTVYPGNKEDIQSLDDQLKKIISLETEIELVRTKSFTLTNFYIIPIAYHEMDWENRKPETIDPLELAGQIRFLIKREAALELIYLKCLEEQISFTEEEVQKELKEQEANIEISPYTKEYILHKIKRDILINKYYEKRVSSITVTPDEIENYYQANRDLSYTPRRAEVRMIYMRKRNTPSENNDILIKMKSIYKRAADGENFTRLAERYSEDKGSRYSGGRLGAYIETGSTYREFEENVLHHPAGTITPVFKTSYGYYIVKIDKVFEPEPRDIATIKDFIIMALKEEKKLQAISHLKKELEIESKLKLLF